MEYSKRTKKLIKKGWFEVIEHPKNNAESFEKQVKRHSSGVAKEIRTYYFAGLVFVNVILSFLYDMYGEEDYHLFSRSGAMLVLSAIFIEYNRTELTRNNFIIDTKKKENFGIIFKSIEFIYLSIGTIIWAYGDINYEKFWGNYGFF